MEESKASPHATTIPDARRRLVIIAIGVVFAVHTLLVTVWVMPPNTFRDAVGQENLDAYITNDVFSFEQSWRVFAPTPRHGDESVKIRAHYGTPGSENGRATEWFDITADEDRRIEYLVNPSRFHSATHRLGGTINDTVGQFNERQKATIADPVFSSSRRELARLLETLNTGGTAGLENIDRYVQNDEMLTRYGTMYATARWGEGVTAVEFQVGHRSVPDFSRRNETDFLDVPFDYFQVGIRAAMPGNADAQEAFDGYVHTAPTSKSTTVGE